MFPSNEEQRASVHENFHADFELAKQCYETLVESTHRLIDTTNELKEIPHLRMAVIGLSIRNARAVQSVFVLLENALVENADALCRLIFEGVLAERFILSEPNPPSDLVAKVSSLPSLPATPTREEFRASLYIANQHLQELRDFRDHVSDATRDELESGADEFRSLIGEDWTSCLESFPYSYSGLKIRELARCHDLANAHEHTYGLQSRIIHAGNAQTYFEFDEQTNEVNVGINIDRLPQIAHIALSVAMLLAEDVNGHFKLELDEKLSELGAAVLEASVGDQSSQNGELES